MRLYDTISQVDLNSVIDKLLNNYHREISLDLDDPVNDYCSLEFDLSDGVDAGSEVIFNDGDELQVSISDERLALMGYTLRFYYYLLDKGDYTQSKSYGELQSFDVKLDDDTVVVPFSDNQVYLQKSFDLILLKDVGYRLLLSASSSVVMPGEDVVLTADYTLGSVPVEDASVSFYEGETLIDTVDTDSDGLAVLTVSDLGSGSHNFSCVCNEVYGNTVNVYGVSDKVMELNVAGFISFSTYSSTPFTFNGRVFVDWGDDSGIVEYTGGKLTHTYSSSVGHTVKIYGDITSLGSNCFDNCTNLTSIVIPNSVTSLGAYCFRNCIGLTSIEIPNSVTSLGEGCFTYCTGLTSIVIPNSVTSLGEDCFEFCSGLTSIKLNWNASTNILTYKSNWIDGTSSSLKFHIPTGTTSLYTAKYYPSTKLVEDNI